MSKIIGYTTGTYDLFHDGHVDFLKRAKSMCDLLIVGVTSDELVLKEKNKNTILNLDQRMKIIEACRYVDIVVPHNDKNGDKITPYKRYKYNVLFIGDDYINDKNYTDLNIEGVKVYFFPYTKSISSTKIKNLCLK